MAPNKKKKKAAANPLRGFATVSQPSKVRESNAEDKDMPTETVADTTQDRENKNTQKFPFSKLTPPVSVDTSNMTPEEFEAHLEECELQNIIELHAARCRQDASRQVSRLQTERRQLRGEASSYRLATASWLDDDLAERLIMDHISIESSSPSSTVPDASILATTDSLLLQLWTLSRTLSSLELQNPEEAIDHVLLLCTRYKIESGDYIWGLREAFEWYAVHCPYQDLPDYEQGAVASIENSHQFKKNGEDIGAQSIQSDELTKLSNERVANKPSRPKEELAEAASLESSGEDDVNDLELVLNDGNEDEDDPTTFIDRYLRLQTSLYHIACRLKQKHSAKLTGRASLLSSKVEVLKRDPLFDLDDAERLWQPRQRELEIDTAQALKAKALARSGRPDTEVKPGEEDNDLLGGIFGNEGDGEVEISSLESSTIKLLDFGDSAGVQPRKLMEECCRNIDSRAKVNFRTLSNSSYSIRQSLRVNWLMRISLDDKTLAVVPKGVAFCHTSDSLGFEMVSVATASPAQAEGFLSTIALFLLTTSGLSEQSLHNRLPTTWRTLYQELVKQRNDMVDEADKVTLRQLRSKINRAHSNFSEATNLHTQSLSYRPVSDSSDEVRQQSRFRQLSPDSAKALWDAKSSTMGYKDMLQVRTELPVHRYKDYVLENFQQHQILVICADTGAGKSTQIPSFILEYGLSNGRDCNVLVTQPRRISAISLARRVSQELGEGRTDLGTDRSLVGYAIRLETKVSRSTRITFATTGVLLRMIESSPELEDIGCVILDEVHERTMDLDLLFIALRKVMKRRPELKVILMSATVDAQKFAIYFDGAPVLSIPGRTFPVDVKYLEDAIEETHGMSEVGSEGFEVDENVLDDSESDTHVTTSSDQGSGMLSSDKYSAKTLSKLAEIDEYRIDYELIAKLVSAIATKSKFSQYSSAILIFMPGIAEMRRLQSIILSNATFSNGWVLHLLHSSFSTEDLERAFRVPPAGQRKIVISTNIAETGITIPDVTAVIDTCKEKIMRFDERRQLSRLTEAFISRSSARQRKGRAARVRAGLCFHLVTKHRYNNIMLEQHVPEMLRLSLQDAILRIKIWNLGSIETTLCSAIDPPSLKNIRRAVEKLKDAGALNAKQDLTPLGKQLARLPLEIVLGKMAMFGIMFKCLDSIVTMVAALSSKSPFQIDKGTTSNDSKMQFSRSDSDLISVLNAYQGWRKAKEAGVAHQFCRKHRLSDQNLMAIEDQKIQLLVYLVDAGMVSLEPHEEHALNKSRSSGHRRSFFTVPERFNTYENDSLLCAIIAGSFYPRLLVREGKGWRNVYTNQHMSLTSNSVNKTTDKPPRWLSFYEAMQSKSGALNVHETTRIPEVALVTFIGEATFRFYSGVIALDNGKARFSLRQWRQLAAIKVIRDHITRAMAKCWQNPSLTMAASDEAWIEAFVSLVAGQNTKTK